MTTGFVDRTKGKTVISNQFQATNTYYFSSNADNLTAAGSSQGTALPVTQEQNRVTTVAAGTGVRLPPAQPGLNITVVHAAVTNALLVYPNGSDTINGAASYSITAAAAGVGVVVTFMAFTAGAWHALKSS